MPCPHMTWALLQINVPPVAPGTGLMKGVQVQQLIDLSIVNAAERET